MAVGDMSDLCEAVIKRACGWEMTEEWAKASPVESFSMVGRI